MEIVRDEGEMSRAIEGLPFPAWMISAKRQVTIANLDEEGDLPMMDHHESMSKITTDERDLVRGESDD